MADFVVINGTPIRATSVYRRVLPGEDGPSLEEIELVVILRGGMVNRSFQDLLRAPSVVLQIPDGPTFETTVANANHIDTGGGESAAHRHDVTLRELPASAQRRAAVAAETAAAAALAAPELEVEEDEDDGPDAGGGRDVVNLNAPASTWATSLRQLRPAGAEPTAPPPPLDPAQLAGAEAVLVGLRLEAVIEALDTAGVIRRSTLDDAFLALIADRFVSEAAPVIGDAAARRVVKDLLG